MDAIPFRSGYWDPSKRRLLADGAWGTEFFKRGLAQGDSPEAWNLDRPEEVKSVARSYVDAGCDIVLTNSFGASRWQLERHGLAARAAEINRLAAGLSRAAADEGAPGRDVVVAGDLGPSGKLLLMGEVSEEELLEGFSEQAEALKAGGADWLVVETMIDKAEMSLAVRAAAATGLPVVASMTYQATPAGFRTMMGDTPDDCAAAAEAAGASLIGANCGHGIDAYVELARALRAATGKPLWIKANAGLPELVDGASVYRMDEASYCSFVPALLDAGVNVVGGCCGTAPSFLARARALVR